MSWWRMLTPLPVASRLVSEVGAKQDPPIAGPLADEHARLGAKMAEFGGWLMPLSYAGVVEEHLATRNAVGIFDVSHLGKALVTGEGVDGVRQRAASPTTSTGSSDGQAQYTLCCDAETGGVVDDLIAYRGEGEVFLIPNAANTAARRRVAVGAAPAGISVLDHHRDIATIAVQGPQSAAVLDAVGLPSGMDYMAFERVEWRGLPVTVCRTGYTGEHGYELLPPAESAGQLWDAVLAAATPLGGLPCGLGARDTLRTEMGYPLHGSGSVDRDHADQAGSAGRLAGQAGVLGARRAGPRSARSARRGCSGGCAARTAASRDRTCRCARSRTSTSAR